MEVGVWKGRSTAFLAVEAANSGKTFEIHAVDWFKGSDEEAHHTDEDIKAGTLLETFLKNIEPVSEAINVHACTSLEAAAKFEDNSVDFVYLDGDHSYEGVKADILAWLPKLKTGGLLSGDDYASSFRGVDKAVNELLDGNQVPFIPVWIYVKP